MRTGASVGREARRAWQPCRRGSRESAGRRTRSPVGRQSVADARLPRAGDANREPDVDHQRVDRRGRRGQQALVLQRDQPDGPARVQPELPTACGRGRSSSPAASSTSRPPALPDQADPAGPPTSAAGPAAATTPPARSAAAGCPHTPRTTCGHSLSPRGVDGDDDVPRAAAPRRRRGRRRARPARCADRPAARWPARAARAGRSTPVGDRQHQQRRPATGAGPSAPPQARPRRRREHERRQHDRHQPPVRPRMVRGDPGPVEGEHDRPEPDHRAAAATPGARRRPAGRRSHTAARRGQPGEPPPSAATDRRTGPSVPDRPSSATARRRCGPVDGQALRRCCRPATNGTPGSSRPCRTVMPQRPGGQHHAERAPRPPPPARPHPGGTPVRAPVTAGAGRPDRRGRPVRASRGRPARATTAEPAGRPGDHGGPDHERHAASPATATEVGPRRSSAGRPAATAPTPPSARPRPSGRTPAGCRRSASTAHTGSTSATSRSTSTRTSPARPSTEPAGAAPSRRARAGVPATVGVGVHRERRPRRATSSRASGSE